MLLRLDLTAESVQSTALAFEGVDDVHGSHGLPLGMLGVCDSITDDVLKEHLQDTTGLLVDEAADTLDTTSAGKTTDGRLGDSLDVITKYLAVTLGTTLSQALASFTTSGHDDRFLCISCKIQIDNSRSHFVRLYMGRGWGTIEVGCVHSLTDFFGAFLCPQSASKAGCAQGLAHLILRISVSYP